MNNKEWGKLIKALETWRGSLVPEGMEAAAGEDVPSVSAIAEGYKNDPWAVLVSTILSLRTKDKVTLAASRALLEKAPDPAALLGLSEDEIAGLIYPAGFYRTKAANLRRIAAILLEKHGGTVPPDMDTLLALPGVGRKTANLVRIEAYDLDGICVDTHVHRISNRQGWLGEAGSKSPDETEAILREVLPREYWKRINALLVLYGQRVCCPVSPYCSRCVIAGFCLRRGVGRTR